MEIEAKLKVDSFEAVLKKLAELGAALLCDERQEDVYFDDADGTLWKADKGLRLRTAKSGAGERLFLSYKGPREKGLYKRRSEVEFAVSDGKAAAELLGAIGYKPILTVVKKRLEWMVENCKTALDEVEGLGRFVEIEGADEKIIAKVQNALGLGGVEHVKESYAQLVEKI